MERILYLDDAQIVGAGGYGLVIHTPGQKEAYKLLYDVSACKDLKQEARLQQRAHTILRTAHSAVCVPAITYFSNTVLRWGDADYLCGIGMEYLPPPLDLDEAVHMVLGYTGDDLDTSWGRQQSRPVSLTNPSRGFFASPETLAWIWAAEGSAMTIETAAYEMGRALRLLLDGGLLPIDVEWIWSNGRMWMVDFGLCEFATGVVDARAFLNAHGLRGLASDFYIPHTSHRGYEEFLQGYAFARAV